MLSLVRNFSGRILRSSGQKNALKQALPVLSSLYLRPIYYFSANKEAAQDSEDSHDDFKPKTKVQITEENAFQQIDDWVKNNKCVLFMKGVPQLPQCGYSKFAVEVLKYYKVNNFKSVDILKDAVLREQVKKYSDWNTYPQLYVDGKLVGGADIMNDMHKDGSLKDLFQKTGLIAAE